MDELKLEINEIVKEFLTEKFIKNLCVFEQVPKS